METVENTAPTFTPNVRGAHLDVLNKLANIVFVEGTNGGMSSEVAYIRYWRRGGSSKKTQVKLIEGRFLGDGVDLPQVAQDSWSNLPTTSPVSDLNVEGDFSVTEGNWDDLSGFDGPYGYIPSDEVVPQQGNVPPVPPSPRFVPLRGTQSVPENTYKVKPPKVVEYAKPTTLQRILFGRSFSANPTGSTLTAEPSAPIEDGVWQFLFNPEELQLESGPDYNRAETWGVSDPANSGQPLSWRNNKNRKLTFSKVILHGYTFGKRVEQLEKGLQDLFMARDGENGADGPPVLEFVWGSRVFGPCVIQNIRVREQAWDKGVLVNAEVSFELEQVPEWTINDGQVDIARPGRQPLVNDELLPARDAAEAAASAPDSTGEIGESEEEPKDQPGGGSPTNKGNLVLANCQALISDEKKWNDLEYSINSKKEGITTRESSFFEGTTLKFQPTYPGLAQSYQKEINKAKSNSFYGNEIKSSIIGAECMDVNSITKSYEYVLNLPNRTYEKSKAANRNANQKILVCSRNVKSVIKNKLSQNKCNNFIVKKGQAGPGITR